MSDPTTLFGAVEAGGTKFICAVGTADGELREQQRIDTRDPATTLGDVATYFQSVAARYGRLAAIGIGTFGPVDIRPTSAHFGQLLDTPKPGWSGTDMLGPLRSQQCALALDTDVNAAALGEWHWGAGRQLGSLAYVTIGTGIGAGVVHDGRAIHGLMHPEMGHVQLVRHAADRQFAGTCPFHGGDCLEGLISGPAIVARTGAQLADLDATHPVRALIADYLGQLCALLVLTHSPQRIVLGGGVMQCTALFAPIRAQLLARLRGYPQLIEYTRDDFISPPALGDQAGIKGALALALNAGAALNCPAGTSATQIPAS